MLFTFSISFMGINLCLFAFVYFSFLFLFMGGDLCFIGYCVRGKCQGVGCVKYMHVVNNPYFYGVINFNNYLDFFYFFYGYLDLLLLFGKRSDQMHFFSLVSIWVFLFHGFSATYLHYHTKVIIFGKCNVIIGLTPQINFFFFLFFFYSQNRSYCKIIILNP